MSGLVTACDIETNRWNKIIETHIANGWTVIEKYDQFDAGNRVVLEKRRTIRIHRGQLDGRGDQMLTGPVKRK